MVYDAEHFFDGFARRPGLRARAACAPPPRRAPSASCCATPTARRCPHQIADAVRAGRRASSATSRVGIHCHNDAECGVANSLVAVGRGATQVQGTINGYGERSRQRQPRLDHRQPPAASMGYEVVGPERLARLTETAHFVDELLNLAPDPNQPYVGKQRLRAQGRACTSPASAPTPRRSSTSTRRWSATRRELLISELSGKGTVLEKARGRRAWRSTTRRPRGSSSASRSSSTAATSSRPPTARSTC